MPGVHDIFMRRCLALAKLALGNVAPNPMVGAVLVHQGKIIGEGYHKKFGEAHAEVNCIANAEMYLAQASSRHRQQIIGESIMYVSLEPCTHFGKTPPCADLLIGKGITKVIIGSVDSFPGVNGRGIAKLMASDI
ncbi:MAG: bifunctional diaminohydroxyphosphoribosylaminopyrimidine deaminase/5-amino-6-(5-phosphoribosylamino)uracil reductase RibD, partial [Chitinophagaceae bacterium]